MILGAANRGKTTLAATLQGKECSNATTAGVSVTKWQYRPGLLRNNFYFNMWDFGGKEEYRSTYQCFLSQQSLYLLVFDLKMGEEGLKELEPWLSSIASRAPKSYVIIVGTHLDEIKGGERDGVSKLMSMGGELASKYGNLLSVVEIIPVALKNRLENISTLKESIYSHAANYKYRTQPIMGQMVPASYHALNKKLELMRQEVRSGTREPIMHVKELQEMAKQMNLLDIQSSNELKAAAHFLTDVGAIMHIDDSNRNLDKIYFIDPCWLFDTMAKFVERNPFTTNGILHCKHISRLLRDTQFPWQYLEQFLTLLDHFEVALPLDNRRVLIPSMLATTKPKHTTNEEGKDSPVYSHYILFNSTDTPPGFWRRLLSHIIHFVPKVYNFLDHTMGHNVDESTASTDGLDARLPPFISSSGISLTSFPHSDNLQSIPQLFADYPTLNTTSNLHDISSVHINFWNFGLVYKDPSVSFGIETLQEKGDGVSICVSMNEEGRKLMCHLVDIVLDTTKLWYPGSSLNLQQAVPCYECLRLKRPNPFRFNLEHCLLEIQQGKGEIECRYSKDPQVANHMVTLHNIVPDLFMHDIDAHFHLSSDEIIFDENESSLLLTGGFGKVYEGRYSDKTVAIKKPFLGRTISAFHGLHSEAKFLQALHHPCIVSLVGVGLRPYMALVLEKVPLGTLKKCLFSNKPIHRITLFRIASQVAAALRFLHTNGVIFRDVGAANVLLWTLDHRSLCHCKIANFECASYLTPIGTRGLLGANGFPAPEILYVGKQKQRSVYNHTADIFSFSMLLYQMIARRDPYRDIKMEQIDSAVLSGKKPKLCDVDNATVAYHYLTKLMKICCANNPSDRPSTENVLRSLCSSVVQSVMSINPIKDHLAVQKACTITHNQFTEQHLHSKSEFWLCSDSKDGTTIDVYSTDSMLKTNRILIKENQIQCICLCKDHIWLGSRSGIEYGSIDIFDVTSQTLVHNIRMREHSASCITCSDTHVYLGTLEGYCFSFSIDIKQIQANAKPRYKYVSEHALQGIVVTGSPGNEVLWVSHTRYINILNADNLSADGFLHQRHADAYIGQLSVSSTDVTTVWSAHIGGKMISAWDATHKVHKFNIDTAASMKGIDQSMKDTDVVITAMTPALDTVWVGMASGHVLLFASQDMLTWYHPYSDAVNAITAIPCSGPCKKEECMVITGAKCFRSPLPPNNPIQDEFITKYDGASGAVILWEAFDAKLTRQMKLIEEKAPHMFNNHESIKEIIRTPGLKFSDGTNLTNDKDDDNDDTQLPAIDTKEQCCQTGVTQSDPSVTEAGLVVPPHQTVSLPQETLHLDVSSIFTQFPVAPSTCTSHLEPLLPPIDTVDCDRENFVIIR